MYDSSLFCLVPPLPSNVCIKLRTYNVVIVYMIDTFSPSVSKADVASSNNNILGSRIKARAMAIRCFCPPERWPPLGPTFV